MPCQLLPLQLWFQTCKLLPFQHQLPGLLQLGHQFHLQLHCCRYLCNLQHRPRSGLRHHPSCVKPCPITGQFPPSLSQLRSSWITTTYSTTWKKMRETSSSLTVLTDRTAFTGGRHPRNRYVCTTSNNTRFSAEIHALILAIHAMTSQNSGLIGIVNGLRSTASPSKPKSRPFASKLPPPPPPPALPRPFPTLGLQQPLPTRYPPPRPTTQPQPPRRRPRKPPAALAPFCSNSSVILYSKSSVPSPRTSLSRKSSTPSRGYCPIQSYHHLLICQGQNWYPQRC